MQRSGKEDFNELALFAGAGGGILGGRLLGWRIRCAVEIDSYCRRVLLARQRDGIFPRFPVWDDVRTFDGHPWRGAIDVISGGFPCTDISLAGKGAGIEGKESGLWVEFARIIREVRPRFVFVENSPALTIRGIDRVLADLASLGYDAEWGVFGAHEVGAPHKRDRIWIVAYSDGDAVRDAKQWIARRRDGIQDQRITESINDGAEWNVAYSAGGGLERCDTTERNDEGTRSIRSSESPGSNTGAIENVADSDGDGSPAFISGRGGCGGSSRSASATSGSRLAVGDGAEWNVADSDGRMCDGGTKNEGRQEIKRVAIGRDGWWAVEPRLGRMAHGVADRVERLKAIGNGQVPEVARLAWDTLIGRVTV